MGNKKDIGTIFKEKLSYLDNSPSENGWNAIEKELEKKKKRRFIVPFWFSHVGIFSAGVFISWLLFSNSIDNEKYDTKNTNSLENTDKNIKNKKSILNDLETNEAINSNSEVSEKSNEGVKNNEIIRNKFDAESKTKISNSSESNYKKKYANKNSFTKHFHENAKTSTKIDENNPKIIIENETNDFLNSNLVSNNINNNNLSNYESNINSVETEIENNDCKDSILKKKIVTETANKDSIIKPIEKKKAMSLFIYGSPTFSVFTKNPILDNRLNFNQKNSEINFSHGLYLCYYGTENLSLRIGIGKNNIKFTTHNVPVNTFNYSNIEYTNNYSNAAIYTQSNNSEFMKIIQDISYIEIPLEVKYKFLNRKIGMNAIFGVNYLLLDKNEISVNTNNGYHFKIGKTANQTERTIGGNFGLGLDYKISKKIKLNIEPMLKYQLNVNENYNKKNEFNFNILTGLEFILF